MYVVTFLYSNKLWTSIPTNRSKFEGSWQTSLLITQFVATTQLIRRVLYSVSFPIEHIMWRDMAVKTVIKEMYNLENKLQITPSYGTIELNEQTNQ